MEQAQAFRPKVGVVGASRMGLTLAEVIARNGHSVVLYTTVPESAAALTKKRRLESVLPELKKLHTQVHVTEDPAVLAEQCELVLFAVSNHYVDTVLSRIGGVFDGAHMMVHAAHVLHGESLSPVSSLVQKHSAILQVGVVAGPMHVTESLNGQPNAFECGSAFPMVIKTVDRVLGNHYIDVHGNRDLRGVEYAAALGQIVAALVGMGDGLGLGATAHATLLTRGLREIASIGSYFGTRYGSFYGLAGLGRLVDAVRRGEPNYQLGLDIGRSDDVSAVLASAPSEAKAPEVVSQVMAFADYHAQSYPLCRAASQIFVGERSAADAIVSVLSAESREFR